ncbi:MAG: hypothetical protein M1828_004276 [Chrysothrix sp. TS-e1954]|nr:MAG: hypothetical protein M1828_004276 [Chrysothrix sp. TS-e1954]
MANPSPLARASVCNPGAPLSGYELPNNLPHYACGFNPYAYPSTFAACCAGPIVNTTSAHPDDPDSGSCIAYCRVTDDQPVKDSPCAPFTFGSRFYDCMNQPSVWGQSYYYRCLGAMGNSTPNDSEGLNAGGLLAFKDYKSYCASWSSIDAQGYVKVTGSATLSRGGVVSVSSTGISVTAGETTASAERPSSAESERRESLVETVGMTGSSTGSMSSTTAGTTGSSTDMPSPASTTLASAAAASTSSSASARSQRTTPGLALKLLGITMTALLLIQ